MVPRTKVFDRMKDDLEAQEDVGLSIVMSGLLGSWGRCWIKYRSILSVVWHECNCQSLFGLK